MYYVYILSNQTNTVLYIGVTNDLHRRLYEHKSGQINGFTQKYHINLFILKNTPKSIMRLHGKSN